MEISILFYLIKIFVEIHYKITDRILFLHIRAGTCGKVGFLSEIPQVPGGAGHKLSVSGSEQGTCEI